MKILLELSYDGTNYHGWQVQADKVTVQSTLQDACERIFGARLPVTGCSRTDSGVHARRFYCTAAGDITVPCERIPAALNSVLPFDISVLSAVEVNEDFHPRYDCRGKEYCYSIYTGGVRDPLNYKYSWQLCRPLDTDAMRRAARYFIGTHDFAGFCASGSSVTDTVRTVFSLDIEETGDGYVKVYVSADGFLYNMVRIIVGTLVMVGTGRADADGMGDIIATRDRSRAGSTAPACGLYLNRVFYGNFDPRRDNGK